MLIVKIQLGQEVAVAIEIRNASTTALVQISVTLAWGVSMPGTRSWDLASDVSIDQAVPFVARLGRDPKEVS